MSEPSQDVEALLRSFEPLVPGKLMGRGHPAGDFLEAWDWDVLERREGRLRLALHLPEHVKNLRGQLFGGFTPTYVDLIALLTCREGVETPPGRPWLVTLNMRVDYYAPVVERFEVESRLVNRRGSTCWVETLFLDPAGELLVFAYTTLKGIS